MIKWLPFVFRQNVFAPDTTFGEIARSIIFGFVDEYVAQFEDIKYVKVAFLFLYVYKYY